MRNGLYFLSFLLMLCGNISPLFGQGKQENRVRKTYYTWLKLKGKEKKVRGHLLVLGDSSILVQRTGRSKNSPIIEEYPLDQILQISFKAKYADLDGIIYGGLGGFGFGGILGLMQEGDYYSFLFIGPVLKGVILGAILSVPGMIAGGIIGSKRKKFKVNGQQQVYETLKTSWEKYIYYRKH